MTLVEQILVKALKGVYRSHLMAHLSAPKWKIARAIREARTLGLYSVLDMRTIDGDTWYQYDGKERP